MQASQFNSFFLDELQWCVDDRLLSKVGWLSQTNQALDYEIYYRTNWLFKKNIFIYLFSQRRNDFLFKVVSFHHVYLRHCDFQISQKNSPISLLNINPRRKIVRFNSQILCTFGVYGHILPKMERFYKYMRPGAHLFIRKLIIMCCTAVQQIVYEYRKNCEKSQQAINFC